MSAFEDVDVKSIGRAEVSVALPPSSPLDKTTSDEVEYIKIGNTMFKVMSYYSDKRTYEDIVKSALLREMENNS
ncbi:MAG: hypothetical protein FWF76_02600 [Oscillospiraceae bacterium]|nr:hypothetical protein [Oscillospiraceae bacterium]